MWQPEGHNWKLGSFPCYDPKKVGWLWLVSTPPPSEPLQLTACHTQRARWGIERHACILPAHLPVLTNTAGRQQDMVLPVMFGPQKSAASPFLGGPVRERKFLAVFKGAEVIMHGARLAGRLPSLLPVRLRCCCHCCRCHPRCRCCCCCFVCTHVTCVQLRHLPCRPHAARDPEIQPQHPPDAVKPDT